MTLLPKLLIVAVLLAVVAFTGRVAWSIYDFKTRIYPKIYEPWLRTDSSVYADVDTVADSDFEIHAYSFDQNKYVDAIPNAWRTPNVASADGEVPSFKMGDNIFIVTFKWVNRSSGLAISNSPDFINELEGLCDFVSVEHVDGNVYTWSLHLNYPRQETALR